MRILVTNDDGIDSAGLHALSRRVAEVAEVIVVAPDREFSGSGASLGTLEMLEPDVRRVAPDAFDLGPVAEAWTVSGPPALCVFFARMGAFGPWEDIDLVVSGINPGVNTGRAIYHSGTVGAVLTGRNGSTSGVAVSQMVEGWGVEGQGHATAEQHWDAAALLAAGAAQQLVTSPPERPVVVNLNMPNAPIEDLDGWRFAEVGTRPPRAVEKVALVPKEDVEGAYRLEMTWGDAAELPAESDAGTVERNLVAVTYLSAFAHEQRDDLAAIDEVFDDLVG